MKYQNANIAMLAILSIAAIVRGFTVQAAEAQMYFKELGSDHLLQMKAEYNSIQENLPSVQVNVAS
ncbi:MAG: hypothetical protein M3297_07600 [Thermoproteota archaeon]|jgi:hypothetical protein|nr:hypothetical protein [Thermoproteota archaeon]